MLIKEEMLVKLGLSHVVKRTVLLLLVYGVLLLGLFWGFKVSAYKAFTAKVLQRSSLRSTDYQPYCGIAKAPLLYVET